MGAKQVAPTGIQCLDCPARSELLYQLCYTGLCIFVYVYNEVTDRQKRGNRKIERETDNKGS